MTQHASKFGIILNANSGVPRSDYIVGIDSLRGIAALTVMFDHLGYVPSDLFKNHHGYV